MTRAANNHKIIRRMVSFAKIGMMQIKTSDLFFAEFAFTVSPVPDFIPVASPPARRIWRLLPLSLIVGIILATKGNGYFNEPFSVFSIKQTSNTGSFPHFRCPRFGNFLPYIRSLCADYPCVGDLTKGFFHSCYNLGSTLIRRCAFFAKFCHGAFGITTAWAWHSFSRHSNLHEVHYRLI